MSSAQGYTICQKLFRVTKSTAEAVWFWSNKSASLKIFLRKSLKNFLRKSLNFFKKISQKFLRKSLNIFIRAVFEDKKWNFASHFRLLPGPGWIFWGQICFQYMKKKNLNLKKKMPKEIRKNGQNPVFWTFWSPLFKNKKN